MPNEFIAGKFKHVLQPLQLNMSNNNSHVSITLTLNFDIKASVFFKRSRLKSLFVVIQLKHGASPGGEGFCDSERAFVTSFKLGCGIHCFHSCYDRKCYLKQ